MLGAERPIAVCPHIERGDVYHIWFTGRGKDRYWVCEDCHSQYPTLPRSMKDVPVSMIESIWKEQGIYGRPAILKRVTNLRFSHEMIPLGGADYRQWIDFQPSLKTGAEWVALSTSGVVWRISPRDSDARVLIRVGGLPFDIDENTSLCVSAAMDYGVIFPTFGQLACIFDLRTGAITAQLNRGDYYTEQTPYPITFFQADGRTLLVGARDWNRLDIIDPATGSILTERKRNKPDYRVEVTVDEETGEITTERGPASPEFDDQLPEHDFNGFRGRLYVSPDERRILENGWTWHPAGIVRVWNLGDWIAGNEWESDESPSLIYLAQRNGHWHSPMCWIDNARVAIWGWGADDDWLIPAVRVFDVSSEEETHWFPGPEVRRDATPNKAGRSMFFDKYLFCVHDDHGTGVWDVDTGEHLHQEPSLKPIHYHPNSKTFLTRTPEGLQLSRLSE